MKTTTPLQVNKYITNRDEMIENESEIANIFFVNILFMGMPNIVVRGSRKPFAKLQLKVSHVKS